MFTGAATALTAGLVAGPAAAASSWHISANDAGYHGAFQGKATTKVNFGSTHGTGILCTAGNIGGSFPRSKVPGSGAVKIGSLKTNTGTGCKIGGTISVNFKQKTPAGFFVSSQKSGTVKGKVAVSMMFSSPGKLDGCEALISGTLPFSYKGGFLFFRRSNAALKVVSAHSCGLIKGGEKAWESATYFVSTPGKTGIAIARY